MLEMAVPRLDPEGVAAAKLQQLADAV